MFGTNWKQKYEAELAAHLETAVFNDVMVAGLTEHQHKLVAQQTNERSLHQSDRRRWEEVLAMKEAAWDKERARLEGKAEANALNAERWLRLIHGDAWYRGGAAEIGGNKHTLWERRADTPVSYERILLPEGENPNASQVTGAIPGHAGSSPRQEHVGHTEEGRQGIRSGY